MAHGDHRMRTSTCAVLCAILAFAACDHTPPPTQPALDAETVRQLFEHMEELVAALRTQAAAPVRQDLVSSAVPAVAAPERTLADASLTALHERLEALEREVAQLRSAAAGPVLTAMRATPPPPKRPASVELAADQLANESTRDNARRSLFMLSMQQVVDQLGMPDSTQFSDGAQTWRYQSDKKILNLQFRDGVVMSVYS